MVERYIAKLRMTPEEAAAFSFPRGNKSGIDIRWLEWEKPNVVAAEFIGSDLFPAKILRKTARDIRDEVLATFRNRIVAENLGTHPKSPVRALKLEALLEHPNVTSDAPREIKMAAEAATDVHDVEMTKEEFDQIERPESGKHTLEPREIRRRRRTVTERTPDGRTVQRDVGSEEEVYVMSFGVIDIG